jgi:anti-sigma factor RsiW
MNCSEIRTALPELLYGELTPAQAQAVQSHLATCAACQAEFSGLKQVSGALDKLTVPPVRVDVGQIYWQGQVRQALRVKRWRRAAVAMTGIAAAVVVMALLQLEVRVDDRQLVLRWGGARETFGQIVPDPKQAPGQSGHERQAPQLETASAEVALADLKLLRDLLHALAADVDGRDRQQQESLAAMQRQLDRLERVAQERWTATVRYVAANTRSENQEKEGVNP